MFDFLSIKKLYDDLDYWKMIGIDSDLYECSSHRLEYLPLVEQAKKLHYCGPEITEYVLLKLMLESKKPLYKQKYLWYLIKLKIKKIFGMIKI
jgi:hypothetical protein